MAEEVVEVEDNHILLYSELLSYQKTKPILQEDSKETTMNSSMPRCHLLEFLQDHYQPICMNGLVTLEDQLVPNGKVVFSISK